MIPFSFSYLRPETLDEAISAHARLSVEGKSPFFYAGGSEIITMCRVSAIRPGAEPARGFRPSRGPTDAAGAAAQSLSFANSNRSGGSAETNALPSPRVFLGAL
jgi:hypothetical protein